MSSPIAPTPIPAGPEAARGTEAIRSTEALRGPDAPARTAATHGAQPGSPIAETIALDALPGSPPAEVLQEMVNAGAVYDRLSAQGRELRFARDAASGRTQIEVRDRAGNLLGQLSPAQALDLAAGAPLGAALE